MRITKKHANLQEDQVYGDQRRGGGGGETGRRQLKGTNLQLGGRRGANSVTAPLPWGTQESKRANLSALIAREKDFIYAMMDVN